MPGGSCIYNTDKIHIYNGNHCVKLEDLSVFNNKDDMKNDSTLAYFLRHFVYQMSYPQRWKCPSILLSLCIALMSFIALFLLVILSPCCTCLDMVLSLFKMTCHSTFSLFSLTSSACDSRDLSRSVHCSFKMRY